MISFRTGTSDGQSLGRECAWPLRDIIVYGLWLIWNAHNDRCFKDSRTSPFVIMAKIYCMVMNHKLLTEPEGDYTLEYVMF